MTEVTREEKTIANALKELRNRCISAALKRYGDPLPKEVINRLELELNAIEKHEHVDSYNTCSLFAEYSLANGYYISTRGTIGSAFISYLCGITNVNPLPAHYWCPKCHHFEIIKRGKSKARGMGYDLPEKACPICGTPLNAEGADIEPEVLFGIGFDCEPEPCINVEEEARPKLVELLKKTFGEEQVFRAGINKLLLDGSVRKDVHSAGIYIIPRECDITKISDVREEIPDDGINLRVLDRNYTELWNIIKKYDVISLPELGMLRKLKTETGEDFSNVKTNDKEILSLFQEEGFSFLPGRNKHGTCVLESKIVFKTEPKSFSDLARITAISHGTGAWENNGEKLIREGKRIDELIAFRDDLMEDMLDFKLDRAFSYKVMNRVRKGKGVNEEMKQAMRSKGVPDWYIDSCNKIKYLYPKSQAVDYMLVYWKLAYYYIHFPDKYRELLYEHERQHVLEQNEVH